MNLRVHTPRKTFFWILFGLFCVGAVAAQAGNPGYDIMKQVNDRSSGNDMTANVLMKIVSKTGNVKTREFTMYELKQKDGGSATLIRFLQPADVKGTSFLSSDGAKSEKSQYIYLPSLKKATRISASDKNKPFMGSDFSYDDFGSRSVDDYSFTLLGEESLNGRACWKIESVSKDKSASTSKIVSLVDKESLIVVGADFYDKAGQLYKQMSVSKYEKISGIWTMVDLEMKNLTTKGSTSLHFDAVKYNTGLPSSMFSKEALGR